MAAVGLFRPDGSRTAFEIAWKALSMAGGTTSNESPTMDANSDERSSVEGARKSAWYRLYLLPSPRQISCCHDEEGFVNEARAGMRAFGIFLPHLSFEKAHLPDVFRLVDGAAHVLLELLPVKVSHFAAPLQCRGKVVVEADVGDALKPERADDRSQDGVHVPDQPVRDPFRRRDDRLEDAVHQQAEDVAAFALLLRSGEVGEPGRA